MPSERSSDKTRGTRKTRDASKKRDGSVEKSKTKPERSTKTSSNKSSTKSRLTSDSTNTASSKSKTTRKSSDEVASKNSRSKPPDRTRPPVDRTKQSVDRAKPSVDRTKPSGDRTSRRPSNVNSISVTSRNSSKPSSKPDTSRRTTSRVAKEQEARNGRNPDQKSRKTEKDSSSRRTSREERNKITSRDSKDSKSKPSRVSNSRTQRNSRDVQDNNVSNRNKSKASDRTSKRDSSKEADTKSNRGTKSNPNLLTVNKSQPKKQLIPEKAVIVSELESGEGEHSLETQESGISVTTPRLLSQDDSDGVDEEVEESISSRLVEVDDAEIVDEIIMEEESPSENYSREYSSNSNGRYVEMEDQGVFEEIDNPEPPKEVTLVRQEEEDLYSEDDFEDYESDFEDDDDDDDIEEDDDDETEDEESDEIENDDDDLNSLNDDEPSLSDEKEERLIRHPSISGPTEASTSYNQNSSNHPTESIQQNETSRNVQLFGATMDDNSVRDEIAKIMRPKTSKSFVNFAKLKERHSVNQAGSQADSRGKTLLGMIRLDTITLDLLTLQPANYDSFISSFGLQNTQQAGAQTNEDNLGQETQTESVEMLDKWTQQPISVNVGPNMVNPPTPADYLGVGGDISSTQSNEESFGSKSAGDVRRLTKFLSSVSRVVLSLLEEDSVYKSSSSYVSDGNLSHGTGGGGFSNHGVLLGGSAGGDGAPSIAALLAGGSVTCVKFSSSDPSIVLTGHSFEEQMMRISKEHPVDYNHSEITSSGLVCVWSVHEPSQPKHILRCNSAPKALSLCPGKPIMVIAGMKDATMAAWDLREPSHLHPLATLDNRGRLTFIKEIDEKYLKDGNNDTTNSIYSNSWRIRLPSFITACNENTTGSDGSSHDTFDDALKSSIISLETVKQQDSSTIEDSNGAFQVVSLSGNGELVWWVVVQQKASTRVSSDDVGVDISPYAGATPWSKVVINQAFSTSVTAHNSQSLSVPWVWCTNCQINPSDANTLFVSTGTGAVRQISRLNQKMHPSAYLPEIEPSCSTTCVAVCPHLNSYLLVGCSDGSVRLHKVTSSKPLSTWPSPYADNPQPVKDVTWSTERPCVFYVHEGECIHVWDLSAGDMLPVASLSTDDLIGEEGPMVCGIAPARLHKRPVVHAVFGSSTGRLILRLIEKDFLSLSEEDYNNELGRFNYYVDII